MKVKRYTLNMPGANGNKWLLIVITVFVSVVSSQAGTNYGLRKSVMAGGGQTSSESYVINSAIGQSVAKRSASSTYQLNAGFIHENRDLIFFNEFE